MRVMTDSEWSRILNRAQKSALYKDPHLRSSPLKGEGKNLEFAYSYHL